MKRYSFFIPPKYIFYDRSIRDKYTIIRITIGIIAFLNISTLQEDLANSEIPAGNIKLSIYVDKMSRVFIQTVDRMQSFIFPFSIRVVGNHYQVFFEQDILTSSICSVLSSTFQNISEASSIDTVIDQYWESLADLNVPQADINLCNKVLIYLLSFEPGYLRYDHDVLREKKRVHPVDHIDVNYSNEGTFKLGLNDSINLECLIKILDLRESCPTILLNM